MNVVRRMRPLMGTYVEVAADGDAAAAAIGAGFKAIEEAAALWSFHSPHSELTCLNRRPGERVPLSRSSVHLLRRARAVMRASGGSFDCTVGGTLVREGALPDHGGPIPLPSGDADDIEIGRDWAMLRRPVRLTLDGIAKGYAVDMAVQAMRRHGIGGGWVNAGGDLRTFGTQELPVHRRELDGRLTPAGLLRDAAMASSAVTCEAAQRDGFAPGRIVSTHAQPAEGVWSVLAPSAWRADALAKVAACTPADRRSSLVQSLGGFLLEATP